MTLEQDLILGQFDAVSFSGRVSEQMQGILFDARAELLNGIADPDASEFSRAQRRRLQAQIDRLLLAARLELEDELQSAVEAQLLETHDAALSALLADAGAPAPRPFPGLALDAARAIAEGPLGGHTTAVWVANALADAGGAARRELSKAILEGESIGQVKKRLRRVLGSASRNRLDVIARTAVIAAANAAREQVYRDNASLIVSYTYRATLDRRTCLVCAPWDGVTAKSRDKLPAVPRHGRCRCTVIPNTERSRPTTRPATIHTTRRVRHRDGTTSTEFKVARARQVSSDLTFQGWFGQLPKATQRDILGKARFELWERGEVKDFKQFVTNFRNDSRILRVEELQRKLRTGRIR